MLKPETQRKWLRRVLRSHPQWIGGHLRLGFLELQSHLKDTQQDLRRVATIRISAEAAKRLLYKKRNCVAHAAFLRAQLLGAMEAFLGRRYREALAEFEILLAPDKAIVLSKREYDLVIEYAAASALALEKRGRAQELLSMIPEAARSKETNAALAMLANSQSATFTQI